MVIPGAVTNAHVAAPRSWSQLDQGQWPSFPNGGVIKVENKEV